MSTCFLLCNDIPRVDSADGGLARRLLVIPFRSLFKLPEDIAKMANAENVYEADSYYDSQEFRDTFRMTFFHVLLGYFRQFRAHGYLIRDIPKSIKDMSEQYLADSDDFLGWFNDVYEKGDGFVQLKDVWSDFKVSDLYQNLTKPEKRIMNRKKMTENIKKNPNLKCYYKDRYRPMVEGRQRDFKHVLIGYRLKVEEVSDDEE
jgi:phage/plasmid-associated DNA primase